MPIDPGRFLQPYLFPIDIPITQVTAPLLGMRQRAMEMKQQQPLIQAQVEAAQSLNQQRQMAAKEMQRKQAEWNALISSPGFAEYTQSFAPGIDPGVVSKLMYLDLLMPRQREPLTSKRKLEEDVYGSLLASGTPEEKKSAVLPAGKGKMTEYQTWQKQHAIGQDIKKQKEQESKIVTDAMKNLASLYDDLRKIDTIVDTNEISNPVIKDIAILQGKAGQLTPEMRNYLKQGIYNQILYYESQIPEQYRSPSQKKTQQQTTESEWIRDPATGAFVPKIQQ